MIRVAQLVTTLARGGAQATVLSSCDMADHGADVVVLAGHDRGAEGTHWEEDAVAAGPVVAVPSLGRALNPRADLAALVWLVRWLGRERPDVLHTHSSKAGVLGRLAAAIAGVPVVHTVHGWSFAPRVDAPRSVGRWAVVALERVLARLTAALVVVTAVDATTGLELGIGRPSQYRVIRSGIDLDRPRQGHRQRAETRRDLGLDRGFVVGTVARLSAQKDLTTLLVGFATACADPRFDPAGQLVVVGDGPDRAGLEAEAARLGVADRVRFLGHRDDAATVAAAFDLFVSTSRWEGLPRAIVEAVAAGVPVVATPVGGVPELIRPDQTGVLVPCGRADEVAAALVAARTEPAPYRRRAEAARAEADAFCVERMRADLGRLWAEVARA